MNKTLQQRAGNNQGIQPASLLSTQFAGRPAMKLTGIVTTILTSDKDARALCLNNGGSVFGLIFNNSGADVEYRIILKNQKSNFIILHQQTVQYGFYGQLLTNIGPDRALFPLLSGWSVDVEIVNGSYQGVTVWVRFHDLAKSFVPIVQPISTLELVMGPPPGKVWQICGTVLANSSPGAAAVANYVNFDSIYRTVATEIANLAGEDFLINVSGPPPEPLPIMIVAGGNQFALSGLLSVGNYFLLAYPDKLKIKGKEDQETAPLYFITTFDEFDLPR